MAILGSNGGDAANNSRRRGIYDRQHPATTGHPSCQEFAAPMTGLKWAGAPVGEIDATLLTFKSGSDRPVWGEQFRLPAVAGRPEAEKCDRAGGNAPKPAPGWRGMDLAQESGSNLDEPGRSAAEPGTRLPCR